MLLLVIVFLVVVSQSAHSTDQTKQGSDENHGVNEQLIRKSSDSVLTQVLLTMSRLQYDVSSLAKSVRDQQQELMEMKSSQTKSVATLKNDLADIKSSQLTQRNSTIRLQKDVTSIKSALKKPAVLEKKGCPAGFKHLPAINGCYKLVSDKQEWSVAALRCRSFHKDAHLVFINNAEEQRHVASLLTYYGCDYCWTGGQRINPSAESTHVSVDPTFVWKKNPTDGSAEGAADMSEMTYTHWETGQPDSWKTLRQNCLVLLRSSRYKWHDDFCLNRRSSLCELDL